MHLVCVYIQATSTTSLAFDVWTRSTPASDPQEHVGPSLSPQLIKHSLQSPVGLSVQPWHSQRPSQGLCGATHIHRLLACNSRTHRCKRIHKRHAAHQGKCMLPSSIDHSLRGSVAVSSLGTLSGYHSASVLPRLSTISCPARIAPHRRQCNGRGRLPSNGQLTAEVTSAAWNSSTSSLLAKQLPD